MGITDVSIADGTTSNVATSTGVAHLLDVDDTTFKYWLSIPVVGSDTTYTFSMVDLRAGEQVTYTATQSDGNITLSWTDPNDHTAKTATYNGSVNLGTMTIEWSEDWTDAQKAFYNKTPPEATFNTSTGSVDWNLRPIGTLLDGVTYTVTFECYPSQETLDLIADLKNGDVTYGDSKYGDVWDYLAPDYTLETNTSASLTYTDTRPGGTSGTAYYDNPEPQPVNATEQITVSKKWNNTLDNRTGWQQNLELFVKRDGVEVHAVELTNTNNWTNKAFISYGIITEDANGVHVKTTGHDYSFSEDVETGYYWEIKAPTVRPMMINGASDPTLLKLLDTAEGDVIPAAISGATGANAKAVDGGKTYYKLTIDGEVKYYVVIDSADAALTAVNHRRSYLDVVKTVTGNHVPEGDEFDFTMTVNNANADTADPDDTNSDAWVWFSIWDTSANAMVTDPNAATATGLRWQLNDETVVTTKPAAANFNGYFCVRSGTTISVNMQNGYSLRFLNLPEGSTYTIAEGTLTNDGYTFVSIEGSKSYDADMNSTTTDDWTTDAYGTVNGQSITGTIDRVETAYKVEVTNQWSNIDVQLKKVEGTELLSGSTFTLYSGDTVIGSYSPGGTASEIDPTTGDEVSVPLGNPIDLGGLGIGIYKLVETEVPTYYKKADDVYFQVYKENGTLKARLVDQTGAPLSDQSMMTSETGSDGPVYTITVNNEREEYSVTVKKLVTGNMGDVNREFSFTWYYTLNGTDSDSQTFTLIHNQTTTLSNIPAGATLTVTETSAQDDGYTTTNNQGNGLTATLAVTEDGLEIVFTNDKVVIPDTGVELPVLPFAIILMLCVTALGVLFISRRRRAW